LVEKVKRSPNPTLEGEYQRRGSCCEYCQDKVPFENITRDHIVPKIKGGSFRSPDMWVFSCSLCNYRKGHKTLDEYEQLSIYSVCKILKNVISRKFMISEEEISKIKYYCRVMNSCGRLANRKIESTL